MGGVQRSKQEVAGQHEEYKDLSMYLGSRGGNSSAVPREARGFLVEVTPKINLGTWSEQVPRKEKS